MFGGLVVVPEDHSSYGWTKVANELDVCTLVLAFEEKCILYNATSFLHTIILSPSLPTIV
jgi:hypothetical protein